MFDSIIKLVIGDIEEKRAYKQMMKRVHDLPKDYRFAFRKIQHYMFTVGSPNGDKTIFRDLTMFTNLVDFFEENAAEGRPVLDVIGSDISAFSDEFMRASAASTENPQEKLNKEIKENLNKKGQ
jgi:DNA-binding ferritin-like protein (Dps family)